MKILAVDDDELILELLKAAVGKSGINEVVTATSGHQAVALIESAQSPFDCFMLDIQMPGMDGIELCAWIKRQPEYAAAPVIMVTAMAEREYVQQAFAAGATDYVTKPFDSLELDTRVGIAYRLISESTRVREKALEVRLLRDQFQRDMRFPYSEPVSIMGVDRVIGLVNMENYLLQMNRFGLFTTKIVPIKALKLEAYYRTLLPNDFFFLLTDVAEALSMALRGTESLLTYVGNGTFVAVLQGPNAISTEAIELTAEGALHDMDATEGLSMLPEISYRCGEPVGIGVFRAGPSAVQTLYSAVAKLDQKIRDESGVSQRRRVASTGFSFL